MAPPAAAGAGGAARAGRSGARARRADGGSRARAPSPWRSTTVRWVCSDGPSRRGDGLRALGGGLRARAPGLPARGDRVAGAGARSARRAHGGRSRRGQRQAHPPAGRAGLRGDRRSSPWPRCAPPSVRRPAPSTARPRRCRSPTTAPTSSPSARPSTGSTGRWRWPRSSGCCAPAARSRSCGTAGRSSRRPCTPRSARSSIPIAATRPPHASGAWRDAFAGRELSERLLRVHPAPRRRRAGGPRRVHELRRRARRRAAPAAARSRARARRRRAGRRALRLRAASLAPAGLT